MFAKKATTVAYHTSDRQITISTFDLFITSLSLAFKYYQQSSISVYQAWIVFDIAT